VLKLINDEKAIVKLAGGNASRFIVGIKTKIDKQKLKIGTRVSLDNLTYTIVRILPREVDPMVN